MRTRDNGRFEPSPLSKERLLAGVKKDPDTGCWLWQRSCNQYGYGYMHSAKKRYSTHRVAYELYIGPIPEKMLVCHTCDTPNCVNPDHLFLGTPFVNQQDMKSKKRSTIGVTNPMAKLNEDDIRAIRKACTEYGLMQKDVAVVWGVSKSSVANIMAGKTWSHVYAE